ncbi:hypothetical protein FA13DRAFT_1739299 [Coprinellus micaceus]|uniref:Uncharacterized protein n=1 Tax=Coprinellus micaceus TaxID=71717 RepID=A0A4Y7SQY8_COPMI|nr:hypothetical protein FA13DRAFT_1739299 [Coprinellus micaceus]
MPVTLKIAGAGFWTGRAEAGSAQRRSLLPTSMFNKLPPQGTEFPCAACALPLWNGVG